MKSFYISYDGVLEPLGQSQIIPYLKGLSEKGIKFILLSYEKKCYSKDKRYTEDLNLKLRECNIIWFRLPYHKRPAVISTAFDMISGLIIAIGIIAVKRPRVIHARAYVPAFLALFFKKAFGIKFIFDMRGFWAEERVDAGLWKRNGILYKVVKSLEKAYLKNSDAVIVLTKSTKEYVKNMIKSGAPVAVIPCAVDLTKFKFDPEARMALRDKYNLKNKFIFLHAGSLEGWYLISEMLDFFKSAKEINPDAHFLMLTHSDKDRLFDLMASRRLSGNDFSIMAVLHAEIPQYLSMADAGIFFLKPTLSMKAASPTKVAEYLACGLPIVTNKAMGDIEEYILNGVTGVTVDSLDSKNYITASQKIYGLSCGNNVRDECRKIAESKLSLGMAVDRYGKIYEEL